MSRMATKLWFSVVCVMVSGGVLVWPAGVHGQPELPPPPAASAASAPPVHHVPSPGNPLTPPLAVQPVHIQPDIEVEQTCQPGRAAGEVEFLVAVRNRG